MSDFSAIDSNFKVETKIAQANLRFYDPQQAPFPIFGVFYKNGKFRRLRADYVNLVSGKCQG